MGFESLNSDDARNAVALQPILQLQGGYDRRRENLPNADEVAAVIRDLREGKQAGNLSVAILFRAGDHAFRHIDSFINLMTVLSGFSAVLSLSELK